MVAKWRMNIVTILLISGWYFQRLMEKFRNYSLIMACNTASSTDRGPTANSADGNPVQPPSRQSLPRWEVPAHPAMDVLTYGQNTAAANNQDGHKNDPKTLGIPTYLDQFTYHCPCQICSRFCPAARPLEAEDIMNIHQAIFATDMDPPLNREQCLIKCKHVRSKFFRQPRHYGCQKIA